MQVIQDTKIFIRKLKVQDFGFYAAASYLAFEYLRPHVIYPAINVIPWTQLSIIFGLCYLLAKKQLSIQAVHLLLLAFFLVAYISCFLSYNQEASFKMIDVLLSWVIVVLFFTSAVRNLDQYKLLVILLFLFLFKMSLFGARTWALRGFSFTEWGISGPSGFFQNSGELSLLMVVFAAMSYGFIVGHKRIHKLYYLAPLTAAMTVLAASSRGSQLALAVVALLFAITLGKIKLKNLFLIAALSWIGWLLLPDEQKDRFSTMGDDKTSESRLVYWEKGLEMLNDHKFFGVGIYAFPYYFEDVYAPYIEFDNFRYRREVAHNTYIQVGSELGYIGLTLYLVLIWMCFRLTTKTRRLVKKEKERELYGQLSWIPAYCTGTNIAIIGYLIGSTFMSVAFYPYLYLFLMLNQALYNVTLRAVATDSLNSKKLTYSK